MGSRCQRDAGYFLLSCTFTSCKGAVFPVIPVILLVGVNLPLPGCDSPSISSPNTTSHPIDPGYPIFHSILIAIRHGSIASCTARCRTIIRGPAVLFSCGSGIGFARLPQAMSNTPFSSDTSDSTAVGATPPLAMPNQQQRLHVRMALDQ